jgi:hypothetical protein
MFAAWTTTLALCALASAGVTIIPPEPVFPSPYKGPAAATSREDVLAAAGRIVEGKPVSIVLSSLRNVSRTDGFRPAKNSFLEGAIEAWAHHQHFVVRPEAVWYSILVQMNFYMTLHADDKEVRGTFVDHEGKKEIKVSGISLSAIIPRFQYEIQKRVKTDWLLDWIQPKFSTSTAEDDVTANVLFMGLMQAYFTFTAHVTCGMPSVTLEGTRADWARLHAKLEKLPLFGKEPAEYAARLRPVLSRFVRTFDEPTHPDIRRFWTQIVTMQKTAPTHVCGAQPVNYASGWITAFQYWDAKGHPLGSRGDSELTLDGVRFPVHDLSKVPDAHASVPMKVIIDGQGTYNSTLVAGMFMRKVQLGAAPGYAAAMHSVGLQVPMTFAPTNESTLQPLSAWFMYRDGGAAMPYFRSDAYAFALQTCAKTIGGGRGSMVGFA